MLPLSVRLGPSRFLDPLLLALVVLAVALWAAFRDTPARAAWGRRARVLAWTAWGGLFLLSLPQVAAVLTRWTEIRGADLSAALAGKDLDRTALVVLAAGVRSHDQSSPPRERLDAAGTERILTASRLFREHPFAVVILSGGPPAQAEDARDLATYLGIPATRLVVENRSSNTRENAAFSAEILRERQIDTVVLVTSATHLRRSLKDFAAVGVKAIPAAADVVGYTLWGVDGFLPASSALLRTHTCLHEILGYLRG